MESENSYSGREFGRISEVKECVELKNEKPTNKSRFFVLSHLCGPDGDRTREA